MNIKIAVKGMHCKSCEVLIKDSLQELEGVKEVNVDHKKGYVEVSFDEKRISMDVIKTAIMKEGYKVA